MAQGSFPVNDNHIAQSLYQGRDDHLPYVETARYLIGKYVPQYWKHDCNDVDFVYMESVLCGNLALETKCPISRELKAKWIARVLDISPLQLYNDPQLSL